MRFDILTIFPGMLKQPLSESILGRASQRKLIDVRVHDLRDWAAPPHCRVDDLPYGGGGGMVFKPEPIFAAVEELAQVPPRPWVVLLSPQGHRLDQALVGQLRTRQRLILICGRYEGVDERVREHLIDEEVSIGDFVLSGGELAAAVVVEAVARQVPGVLGDPRSVKQDSFSDGLLDYPHYTRPAVFRGWAVPEALLSGHHAAIEAWRRREAVRSTRRKRPDLLGPSDDDRGKHGTNPSN
ncbi:MAG: tRNA (guanosine(37)-N1)-methyltransferase TrmD [Acidobacteriota bacterium]